MDEDVTELVPTGEMPEDIIVIPVEEVVTPEVISVVDEIPSFVINRGELIGKALGFFKAQGLPIPHGQFANTLKKDSKFYEVRLK